jgi:5-methylcytosine-specific restriction endonuclease McrA
MTTVDDGRVKIKVVAEQEIRRRQRRDERAVAAGDQAARSEHGIVREIIPDDVKTFVWQRDQGECVNCKRRELLELDHIIPLSMGGGSTARNLQLLCENCNRLKGGNLT